MSDKCPESLTVQLFAKSLKLESYPVRLPPWAVSEAIPAFRELSEENQEGVDGVAQKPVKRSPLSLETAAGICIVTHSDGNALQR